MSSLHWVIFPLLELNIKEAVVTCALPMPYHILGKI